MFKNGLILTVKYAEDEPADTYVYQESDEDDDGEEDARRWAELLWKLTDEHGPESSRYSTLRVMIRLEPGDKHDDGRQDASSAAQDGQGAASE